MEPVCQPWFAQGASVSGKTLSRAGALAKAFSGGAGGALPLTTAQAKDLKKAEEKSSEDIAILNAVLWIIKYAERSAAEEMPGADASRGVGAAQAAWGGDTVDKICHLRLHENEIMQFFTLYQLECGEGLPSLRYADFCRVFKKDKRLAHIGVARKRDNFGECSKCTAFKQLLGNHRLDPEAREKNLRQFKGHLAGIALDRMGFVERMMKTTIRNVPGAAKPILENSVSITIDKMTKRSTAIPSCRPMPKCLDASSRIGVAATGVLVAAVGTSYFLSLDSQSGGCNLTIECLERCLTALQKKIDIQAHELFVQGDNHHDVKTSAVVIWLGTVVSKGIFNVGHLDLMIPGHGHTIIDQRHSKSAQQLKKRTAYPISPRRLVKAFKDAYRNPADAPAVEDVHSVRDFSRAYASSIAAVGLGRLACSSESNDAQYRYTVKRYPSGMVGLTYQGRSFEAEIYPRPLNVSDAYRSATFGPGTVIDTTFNSSAGTWACTIQFPVGETETVHLFPNPINLFPSDTVQPLLPVGEPMRPDWPGKFSAARRNVNSCIDKLPIFSQLEGVLDDWGAFFETHEAKIAAWKSTGDDLAPYFHEAHLPLVHGQHLAAEVHHVRPLHPVLPTGQPPYPANPVTHAGYTDAQRRRVLQAQVRLSDTLALHSGYLLVRLSFGTPVPVLHVLPWCLAMLPAGLSLAGLDADSVVSFFPFFTAARSLEGAWKPDSAHSTLSAPFGSVFVSGLNLSAAAKLDSASCDSVRSRLSAHELGISNLLA
jgi:hypothetical protein